jgi:hypothetical protein
MSHIIIYFRPLRYLEPGTGSILIQLIVAALGGGLFFFIKSKWNSWFKKGKNKRKIIDDIEENTDDADLPTRTEKKKRISVAKTSSKVKQNHTTNISKKSNSSKSKKRG